MSSIPYCEGNILCFKPLCLFIFLSLISFLLFLLQRLPGGYELPPAPALHSVPDSTATPTQAATSTSSSCLAHLQTPEPCDRGIDSFTVYKRFSCTFPHWIFFFTVGSSSAGRANEERVLPASHSLEMWTEKSNVLDCSRRIPQNQSLTKTIKGRSF